MNPGELSLKDPYAQAWQCLPDDIEEVKRLIDSGYKKEVGFLPASVVYVTIGSDYEVLDFGCGIGRNVSWMYHSGADVTGYDNITMLEKMSPETQRLYKRLYRFESWDKICKRKFDLIFASLVLQHMSEKVLRGYLEDFVKISKELHILSRWYIDEDYKLIWPILKDYYNCKALHMHTDENVLFAKTAPENQLHFEAVLTPK